MHGLRCYNMKYKDELAIEKEHVRNYIIILNMLINVKLSL